MFSLVLLDTKRVSFGFVKIPVIGYIKKADLKVRVNVFVNVFVKVRVKPHVKVHVKVRVKPHVNVFVNVFVNVRVVTWICMDFKNPLM